MRRASHSPNVDLDAAPAKGAAVRWEVPLEAATPIFKGGAGDHQHDPGRPFRAPAIKGLLRWWWRATVDISDLGELWRRERDLWGMVHKENLVASRVRVGVVGARSESVDAQAYLQQGYGYALWVQMNAQNRKLRVFHREGATARLRVEVDAAAANRAEEVRKALAAFLVFGGIGGRTRRGLGKVDARDRGLVLGEYEPASLADLPALLDWLSPPGAPTDWPSLRGARLFVGPAQPNAMKAWKRALDTMQTLRMSTTHGQQLPLRAPTGYDPNHWKREDYDRFSRGNRFTSRRAALGLPLQFQSWGGRGPRRFMQAQEHNRVPSPVLVHPLRLGARWRPAMLVLRGPWPQGGALRVKGARGKLDPAGIDVFAGWLEKMNGWRRVA